ncbi:hypothetical protein ES703_114458 [subsurface metagenome]
MYPFSSGPAITNLTFFLYLEIMLKAFARALDNLLNSPNLCKEMGENGKRLVKERFTWDKIADQMINLYEEVIYRSTAR